jgi:heterodisulfide reductase subunit C/nitrate reductase gamma subunit
MFFSYTLYLSLIIFCIGLSYRVWTWFKTKIGPESAVFSVSDRATASAKAVIATLFSRRIFALLKVLVLDIILQIRFLREDFLRWLMHMLIFVGFMLLLLMHALDQFITKPLFHNYYSTVNPFMFLRDLFGLMVLAGLAIAVYRRVAIKKLRTITRFKDIYVIFILAVIIISGMVLEGAKITSYNKFTSMEQDYAGLDDEADIQALESYWVQNFGVVSPNVKGPFDEDVLLTGQDLHESNCMDCHSSPQWAFGGWAFANILSPVALTLDQAGGSNILWYIHFLACFLGLAYLPFSKFFHIFSTPIGLMVNEVYDRESAIPANAVTQKAMELDACTRCGTCSLHCSVAPVFSKISNINILPSEKLTAVKALAGNKQLDTKTLHAIQEGSFICTTCNRCTNLCPVGIDLQNLWLSSREDLVAKGFPEPQAWSRGDGAAKVATIMENVTDHNARHQPGGVSTIKQLNLSDQAHTFSGCMKCMTCTVECPVVANYQNPSEALDLMPHQIMHALGLGLKEMVLGSRMIWDCLGCYLCQEKCPMGVNITDVLYELKNIAYNRLRTAELAGSMINNPTEQRSAG